MSIKIITKIWVLDPGQCSDTLNALCEFFASSSRKSNEIFSISMSRKKNVRLREVESLLECLMKFWPYLCELTNPNPEHRAQCLVCRHSAARANFLLQITQFHLSLETLHLVNSLVYGAQLTMAESCGWRLSKSYVFPEPSRIDP